MAASSQAFALSESYDCLSFLIDAVDIPDGIDLEIALKETASNDDPAETFPKRKLSEYAPVDPGWCRVQIPVDDLLQQGGTPSAVTRSVERDQLGEMNLVFTTTDDAPESVVLEATAVIDDLVFEACDSELPPNVAACESP